MSDDYDTVPYAYAYDTDYDKIDDTNVIDQDIPIQLTEREGPLPTPGYDHLLSQAIVSTVYRPIHNYEQPMDREDIRMSPCLMLEPKSHSDIDRSFADEQSVTANENLPGHVEIIGETEENYAPLTFSTVCVAGGEINRSSILSSESVNEIPSSYLRINQDDTRGDKKDGFDLEEIPSSYLKVNEDVTHNDCPEEIPSSYMKIG